MADPAVRSTSSLTSGTRANSTITAPSGIQNGDKLIYILSIGGPAGPTATAPSGFTALPGYPMAYSRPDPWTVRIYAWEKTASSESGSYASTHASASTEGFMYAVSSAGNVSPNPTTNVGASGSAAGPITATGLTTPANGALVIYVAGSWNDIGPTSPPTGTTPTFTERRDAGVLYVADGILATAGATGDKSITAATTFQAAWAASLISIAPGGGTAEDGDYTAGGEFDSAFSALATAVGLLSAGVTAGAAQSARAAAAASVSAGIEAGESDSAILAALRALSASAEADATMAALAIAAGAITDGIEAGESWAASAQAAASLTAAGDFGATFDGTVDATELGAMIAGTEAADTFVAAAAAIAELTSAASMAEAIDAIASAIGAFAAAATFGAVFVGSTEGDVATPRSRQLLVRRVERVALQSKTSRSVLVRRRFH